MGIKHANPKEGRRIRRKRHIRRSITGTAERPRMTIYRSNRHMYVQVIDDASGSTLVSANTMEGEFKGLANKVEDAAKLGETVGKRCKDKKIGTVVFDRNGFRYHGIVKAIADGARKSGLEF